MTREVTHAKAGGGLQMLHQHRHRVARDRIVDAEIMRLDLRSARLRSLPGRDVTEIRWSRRLAPSDQRAT
jgi:hypothetical protein